MGGRLNPQSPELKLKDSIRRELKNQEKQTPSLNCYGEKDLSIIELKGTTIKKIKELPYMERLGIAKWFKKHNELSEFLIDLLFIDVKHLPVTNVNAINPVAKCYINQDEYKHLTGHDYVEEPKKRVQAVPLTQKMKDRVGKIVFSESDTILRKFSIDGGGKKKSRKKSQNKTIKGKIWIKMQNYLIF